MTIDLNIVIGVIGGIALPLFTFLYWKSRKKDISYAISDTPVFSIHKKGEIDDMDLRVLYLDKPVENLRLVTIKIQNSGNVPIRAEDYAEAISFCPSNKKSRGKFFAYAEVVSAPKGSKPKIWDDLNDEDERYRDLIAFEPMLLNPKDSVVVKIVVD